MASTIRPAGSVPSQTPAKPAPTVSTLVALRMPRGRAQHHVLGVLGARQPDLLLHHLVGGA